MDRRSLLKATGLSALATSAALHPAAAAGARPRNAEADVIVIGAGFAGVTAARELSANGLRPLLVEARDRIGGRTWTDTFLGRRIELGCQWISDRQQLFHSELARYGISTVTDPAAETVIFPSGNGLAEVDPAEVYTRQSELLGRLFAGSESYLERPTDPLYRADLIRGVDHLSLRDRLDQLALAPADENWINGTTASYSGGSSALGGLTALAQWWRLGGGNIDGWYGLLGFSPAVGMGGLLQAMLDDTDGELMLNTPVRGVTVSGRCVYVTTSRGTLTAPAVVVAVPVNVWRTIQFSPGLPKVHTDASLQGVGVPDSVKFWVHARTDRGRVSAQAAEGFPISSLFTHTDLGDGHQLIIGFSEDRSLDFTNRAQIQAVLRQMVPGIEVWDLRSQDWGRDRYSRGAWALRRPKQLLAQLPAIQQPYGRIAFASGDTATAWNGFVDGAIESGLRAARQVLEMRR
ncbi:flavin monoamine oxidase family protein [Micromonospora chokoriensis]|uniref:Monoamine oxidase n=1 Tax=Micromonospora chokoriensis TaxID=356851 RepID=A0A1C4XDV8_9ACTN|nr:NAD(P)/FAD-dependent oxidoreductase [Micromonospora chokoriensis]SCF06649.1 Monoamine oxidase [Micromonospora chokoriensis]